MSWGRLPGGGGGVSVQYPKSWSKFYRDFKIQTAGKSWVKYSPAGTEFGGDTWYVSPPADGDTVIDYATLDSGNYVFELHYCSSVNRGIADIYIGGNLIGSVDMYTSAEASNQRTAINFTVSSPGTKEVKIVINGKNASSSDYILTGTKAMIRVQ